MIGLKSANGLQGALELMREIARLQEFDAIITKTSKEINLETEHKDAANKVSSDTYRVDVYPKGLQVDSNGDITGGTTYGDLMAFSMYYPEQLIINQTVVVKVLDNYGFICPPRIPRPTVQYTVLEAFDNFLTLKFDGVRFLNYLNTTFLDV